MNLKNKTAMKNTKGEFDALMQRLEVPVTAWAPTAKTVKDKKDAIWKKRDELWADYHKRVQNRQDANLQMQQMAQQMQPIQWQPGQISTYSALSIMIAQL
jgi:ribosome-binding protein aMBF1 (putative translation factor)